MQIGVIGTGYVGLVTGACFAEFGLSVACVDKDEAKIRSLKRGKIPFFEPGLEELVKKNVENGRLRFSTKIAEAVSPSIAVFIAVGTPPRGDGSANLKYIDAVAKEIGSHIDSYKVIITKSTVPVGTAERIKAIISKNLRAHMDFDVVSNPEFLREGAAIEDFMRPNRVVIGADSQRAVDLMKELYRPLYLIETPFVITDIKSSELIKYASNCFLATKISFINEMANLCEKLGADVHVVSKGMGLDERIGPRFLHPGPGFGGSCFPKDTKALINIAHQNDVSMSIIESAVEVNERQHQVMVNKIRSAVGRLEGKTMAVLGLSFKPNTDDMRDAPSVFIINKLLDAGAKVRATDPAAVKNARKILGASFFKDTYSAVKGADAVVIVTEWNEFRNLDLSRIRKLMKGTYFFDLRNIYESERMRDLGFEYYAVGRP